MRPLELLWIATGFLEILASRGQRVLGPMACEPWAALVDIERPGVPRTIARRRVPMHASSRVGVEWSAPSYAGHTGWSRHAAAGSGHKRKTRSEWQMTRDTHPALVMDTEAETMLSQLEPSRVGDAVSRAKASINATNRRAGLLCTPDGTVWSGHATHCRRKCNGGWHGRLVPADLVELAVLGQ